LTIHQQPVAMIHETEPYEAFMIFRDLLIDKLEAGLIDKNQFLEESYTYFENSPKPLPGKKLSSYSEGMYLYQYYNAHAKVEKATYQKKKYKEPFEAVEHRKASDKYYKLKEQVSLSILRFLEFKGIEAYYIQSDSRKLKHKLVEVLIQDHERGILHTLDHTVIEALKKNDCLDFRARTSKIDEYVNTKYY
jgi:hypothetical protein